jgi:hypothetical protein
MTLYRYLKMFTAISFLLVSLLISVSYINALGCQFTIKHQVHDNRVDIYSTCNSGVVTTRVTSKTKPYNTIFEMSARLFSLYGHQMVYIKSWNQEESGKTLNSPFYITFSNNAFLYSSVNRFDHEWIGIHMDNPINLSYIAKIEGYLDLQDRYTMTQQ